MPYFDPDYFDPSYFDAGPVIVHAAFELYRNGSLEDVLWDDAQYAALSLGMVAYDGQVGTGQIVIPGDYLALGWQIGDRISLFDPDSEKWLATVYLMRPVVTPNPLEDLALQTTWQTMDLSRLFIGRSRDGVDIFALPMALDDFVSVITAVLALGTATIDSTTYVDIDATLIGPPKTYVSDGASDAINDVIHFTAKTVYLSLTDDENSFALHVHDLDGDDPAGLTVSMIPADLSNADTFAPGGPTRTVETADLHDGVTGKNGVTEVVSAAAGTYSAGGLGFEAILDYGGIDEDGLVLATNSVISTGSVPKLSRSFTLYNLTGEQVAKARPGQQLTMLGDVFALGAETRRISAAVLKVSRGENGSPRPGYWDLDVTADYPIRGKTAILGQGGQGGALGAFAKHPTWDSGIVLEDDPAVPVGSTETATYQLIWSTTGEYIPTPNVLIQWTVVKDDVDTPHPDYSTLDDDMMAASFSVTDISGQAHITVSHDSDTEPTSPHRVKGEPV